MRTLALCSLTDAGFWHFLPHWQFVNRETGAVTSFAALWPGQQALAECMTRHRWLYALKAGKLGFSELACAYDGWVARFGPPNARVHLFSRGGVAARELLGWVRFGLLHLPGYMRLPVVEDAAGGNTSTSLKLNAAPDDVRTVVSYSSGPDVSIDQTCTHLHADEFARWPFGEMTWAAAQSTVSPSGSCHIVTRGRGNNWAGKIYRAAREGQIRSPGGFVMQPAFASYAMRPGRDGDWRASIAGGYTRGQLGQFAPETWQEALAGDTGLVYPMFDEHKHVQPLAATYPLHTCKRVGVGLDPGGGNPTAMVLVGERASRGLHQYAEFYRPGASIGELVAQLSAWATLARREPYQLRVACDGSEPVLIASLQEYGFDCVAADKDRQTGIQLEAERLNAGQHTVEPTCVNTIDEFYDYRWGEETDRDTRVVYAGERPVKHHADAMDARRYIVMDFAQYEPDVPVQIRGRRL